MARRPKPRWHVGNQLWVSDVGEHYVDGRGRPRRRTVSFPGIGRKETARAKKALDAFLEAQAERDRAGLDPTAVAVCELYLEWLEANREPATFEAVAGLLGKFATAMGARRVSTLEARDLETALDVMKAAGNRPSYRAAYHAAVQAAFNWAAKRVRGRSPERLIEANPFASVPKPRVGRAPERYASRDELAAFLRWAWRHGARSGSQGRESLELRFNRQLCLMLRVLAHTGARPGELCIAGRRYRAEGLTWDKWNPSAHENALGQAVGVITLAKHKTSGKTGRVREIVVPPALTRALERHRRSPWAHPAWVFSHRRGPRAESRGAHDARVGEPWTSAGLGVKIRKLRKRAIAAGVKLLDEGDNRFTAYRLRHTRITDLVREGLSHDQAAALTGTSGRMIETVYAHLVGSRLAELDQSSRRRKGGK